MASTHPVVLLILFKENVDVDTVVDAPPGISPPPICHIVVPRLKVLLNTKYPFVSFVFAHSSGCLKRERDQVQKANAILCIDNNPELFEKAYESMDSSKLMWIHSYFAGVDKIIPLLKALKNKTGEYLSDSKIPFLTNSKGAFSRSLGEWVIATSLYLCKNISRLEENRKKKRWDRYIMGELHGKTMGFVGYGDIAACSAKLAKAFGMRCIAIRRIPKKDPEGILDQVYAFDDPEASRVYKESDLVVCSLPETPDTIKFVDEKAFSEMKKSSFFISVGRGSVVDETALDQALRKGNIAGAALDVFEIEPLPANSPLWEAPNLLISSHNADWIENFGVDQVLNIFEKNLKCFLNGAVAETQMFTPCNKMLGY